MKILVFDNYDSFTYNLVHLVENITNQKVTVVRNDQIDLDDVAGYDKIILSPGPGIPSEAGLLLPLIKQYAASKSILGVCLGHQAIGEVFGATLENLSTVYHGVATPITIGNTNYLFNGLEHSIEVGRVLHIGGSRIPFVDFTCRNLQAIPVLVTGEYILIAALEHGAIQ